VYASPTARTIRAPNTNQKEEQAMTIHGYLMKAIQDDARRAGERNRLLLEARRARRARRQRLVPGQVPQQRWWAPAFLGRLRVRRPSGQVGNGREGVAGAMTTTTTGSTGTSSYPASAVALGRMFSSEGVPRDE
jgi:hypothetical protein